MSGVQEIRQVLKIRISSARSRGKTNKSSSSGKRNSAFRSGSIGKGSREESHVLKGKSVFMDVIGKSAIANNALPYSANNLERYPRNKTRERTGNATCKKTRRVAKKSPLPGLQFGL